MAGLWLVRVQAEHCGGIELDVVAFTEVDTDVRVRAMGHSQLNVPNACEPDLFGLGKKPLPESVELFTREDPGPVAYCGVDLARMTPNRRAER